MSVDVRRRCKGATGSCPAGATSTGRVHYPAAGGPPPGSNYGVDRTKDRSREGPLRRIAHRIVARPLTAFPNYC